MKKLTLLFIISNVLLTFAQFTGGNSDGFDAVNYIDGTNIFKGGNSDGFDTASYIDGTNIFKGGNSDGSATASYIDGTNIFKGGNSDGFSSVFYTDKIAGLTYVPDNYFEQTLINLGLDSGALDNYVPTANIKNITSLTINNKNISNLIGIEDFEKLKILKCKYNNISNLYLNQNLNIEELYIGNNQLEFLDVSDNFAITTLDIKNNLLPKIDITKNTNLSSFNCLNNQITTLDVTQNTLLQELNCSTNQITSLDVSNNTLLTYLNTRANNLSSLNSKNGNNVNVIYFDARINPNLTCIKVNFPTYCTNNWTNIDAQTSFNLNCDFIKIDLTAFLQGAYINPNAGEENLMRDDLRTASLLPTTSPYTDALTCNPNIFTTTGNNAIVDWVWIELRDKNDNTNIVASKSALLQRDGDIVSIDGVSPISFTIADDNYFVAISHRTHLGIITANTITLNNSVTNLDLSTGTTIVNGGSNAVVNLGNGKFGLYSGDFDGNGQIQNTDLTSVTPLLGQPASYEDADLDMNSQVQNTDINNLLNPNKGKGQQFRMLNLKLFAKRKE